MTLVGTYAPGEAPATTRRGTVNRYTSNGGTIRGTSVRARTGAGRSA